MSPLAGGFKCKQQNSTLQFAEVSPQFVSNGWRICMQTMLKAVRTRCSNTYALTQGHRSSPKGSLTRECSAPALTCLSLDAGVEIEAGTSTRATRGRQIGEKRQCPFQRSRRRDGVMERGGWKREEEWRSRKEGSGGLLCCILTGDLGHFAHEHICYGVPSSFPKQCQRD